MPTALAAELRVLVVDDNPDALAYLRALVESQGYDAAAAGGGAAALRCAEGFRPDVVLLDLSMPGLDGYEVARRLRASGSAAFLVAVTGLPGGSVGRLRVRDAGFDLFVPKPVDPLALLEMLGERAARPGRR